MNFELLKGSRHWLPFFMAALLLCMAGCASIDSSDYRQTVLVTSNPPGALIYDHEKQIGVTPGFVRVRRRHHPQLTLELYGHPPVTISLRTHYRWGDSFGANFVVLNYAPIGWGIDWWTGTAWKIDDPYEVKIKAGDAPNAKPDLIAVAPPAMEDREVAEALGPVLVEKLRASTSYNILNYEKMAPLFSYYGSENGLTEKKVTRYNLFYELKADHILTSKAEPTDEGYLVRSELLNVYTGKSEGNYTWKILPDDAKLKDEMSSHRYYMNYFHLLPNTIFLNFADFNSQLNVDGVTYQGHSTRGSGFTDRLKDYFSAISFAHMDRPRDHVIGHWTFSFVPTGILSNRKIQFVNYPALNGVHFDRWYISAGAGGEVGHLSRIGYFYFDLIPMVTWTRLEAQSSGFDERLSRTWFTTMEELGYSYFFNSHIMAKVYLRSLKEDQALWARAVHNFAGPSHSVSSIDSNFAGIAFGYYFPMSMRDRKEGWRVIDQKKDH